MIMPGTHDSDLVLLSVVVAMFASFAALSLAGRLRVSRGGARRIWLAAAALAGWSRSTRRTSAAWGSRWKRSVAGVPSPSCPRTSPSA
ncbi:MHYT domain-containing protein [Sphingomonas guangdongensis]|uniref:MHYT domain-containing protein n=1 Tax=Sphingomonas guangdongensis TaxID=1141890 RepID=UPI000BE2BE70|nr:MHYT domain-containing protein [Sphingomonas guangdongensis]